MTMGYVTGASGGTWDLMVETAFNRQVAYELREEPKFRQLIDYRPDRVAMPGETVELTFHNDFPNLATTPLTEAVDPDTMAPATPTRVPVTVHEYGASTLRSLYIDALSFTQPMKEVAVLLARHQQDTVDALVRAVMDAGTNALALESGTMTTSVTLNSILATDIASRKILSAAVKLLRRNKVAPRVGTDYLAVIHPDVSFDVQNENSATAWVGPHTYGGDTAAMYDGMVGRFMGATYIESVRGKVAANTAGSPVDIYNTYFLGREALAEVAVIEPHVVVGENIDRLKRLTPLGWHCMFGQALYRPEALLIVQTASSLASL